jgi:hypothetical protein
MLFYLEYLVRQEEPALPPPEAIRRLVELGLKEKR